MYKIVPCLFVFRATAPQWAMASLFTRFIDHTQRRTTVGRTPLDEWSAPRRDLYLTTHNTHNKQTSMPIAGFEPTISADERPQTYALDCADTGTGKFVPYIYIYIYIYIYVYKGKAVQLQVWSGPEGSRKLRFPDFMKTAQDGGKVVSLTHRPSLPPGNTPGTHFC